MLVDLAYLRREIERLRDRLDHRFLDEVAGLGPATLENLCAFIRARPRAGFSAAVRGQRRAPGQRRPLPPELVKPISRFPGRRVMMKS